MNILLFSTLFPNACQPANGIFVETRLRKLIERHPVNVKVVAPVPWFPFTSGIFGRYGRFARVPRAEQRNGLEVLHPRYPLIPKVGMNSAPGLMAKWTLKTLADLHHGGFKIDLIDAHYFYPDGVAAGLVSKALGIPFVVTARGTDINLIPQFDSPRRQIIQTAGTAARIITVCEALREAIIDLGISREQVVTLRNGVDLELFCLPRDRNTLRESLGIRRRTLLSVGHLIDRKGHDLVIRALAKVPDTDLVVIGSGEKLSYLQDIAQACGVRQRVNFTGNLPQARLVDYYGAADALVLASDREGWPNVLLESMACGCPVIASPIWGTPEVIREKRAGLLMKDRSREAIVQGVGELFSCLPERADTRVYAEQFDWDATSDGQWNLFNEITASGC